MVVGRIGAALAITAMMIPVASPAAVTASGTVSSGAGAFIARDGTVIPAVPGMKLYSSDRVITRAGGLARVTTAKNCSVTVGASSMLPIAGATCSKLSAIGFDEGRAGYGGRSSGFSQSSGLWALDAALAAIFVGGVYLIMHQNHHHHPVSP